MKLAILPSVADNSFRANYSRGLIVVFAQTSPPNVTTRLTLDEYRAMEQTSPERHEYRNGEIITMSGGTETHSAIASNFLIYLGFLLRDTDFRLYNSDLRVWIPEYQCGTYTDLMVVNGEPEFNGNRNDEILNPMNQSSMAIAMMKFSIQWLLSKFYRPLPKHTTEAKSSENIALLPVFVNICL